MQNISWHLLCVLLAVSPTLVKFLASHLNNSQNIFVCNDVYLTNITQDSYFVVHSRVIYLFHLKYFVVTLCKVSYIMWKRNQLISRDRR